MFLLRECVLPCKYYNERRFGTIIYNIEMTYIQARGHAPVEVGMLLELQEQLEEQLELEARMPLEC